MTDMTKKWQTRITAATLTAMLTIASTTPIAKATTAPVPRTGGPNQSFVIAAYVDFAGRGPTKPEVIQLNTGTAKGALVNALVTSAHWDGVVIKGYYQSILHRTPSAAALANWLNQVRAGHLTLAGVAERFYASDEYYLAKGSLLGWVISLYHDILHTTGTPAHIAGWMDVARTKGRLFVATAFYESLGSRLIRTTALYTTVLRRNPSAAAQAARAAELLTGGDRAVTFDLTNSHEYYVDAGTRYPHYTVTILGALPGDDLGSLAFGVNDNGLVVGDSIKTDPLGTIFVHAFVYNPATHTMSKIEPLPGDNSAVAVAVNNNGLIAGNSFTTDTGTPTRAFTYDMATSTTTDIAASIGKTDTAVTAINNNGIVIGGDDSGAFAYNTATHTTTQITHPGWGYTKATGINDAGDISLTATIGSTQHAYVYNLGTSTLTDLSSKLPAGPSEATGANNAGIVVGTATNMAYTYDIATGTVTSRSPGLTATYPTDTGPLSIGGGVIAGRGPSVGDGYFYNLATGRESFLEGAAGTFGGDADNRPVAVNANNEIVGTAFSGGREFAAFWQ